MNQTPEHQIQQLAMQQQALIAQLVNVSKAFSTNVNMAELNTYGGGTAVVAIVGAPYAQQIQQVISSIETVQTKIGELNEQINLRHANDNVGPGQGGAAAGSDQNGDESTGGDDGPDVQH